MDYGCNYTNKDLEKYLGCVVCIDNFVTGFVYFSQLEQKFGIATSKNFVFFNGFDDIKLLWKEKQT